MPVLVAASVFKYFTSKLKGNSSIFNFNPTVFTDQYGNVETSSDISLDTGPVKFKLTSSIGAQLEVGVDELFNVSSV